MTALLLNLKAFLPPGPTQANYAIISSVAALAVLLQGLFESVTKNLIISSIEGHKCED